RVAAYDEDLAAQELAEIEARWSARREQVREEAWSVAQRLLARAKELLDHPTTETSTETVTKQDADGRAVEYHVTIVRPARWDHSSIVKLAESYNKIARLAVGMDTAQQRVIVVDGLEPKDLADLSDEELAALEQRMKKGR